MSHGPFYHVTQNEKDMCEVCEQQRMARPANDEMVQGFRDGYDLEAPEPSANRSESYRHGFMCARIDKGLIPYQDTAGRLRDLADKAMEVDEARS